jgi:hypothetical protein
MFQIVKAVIAVLTLGMAVNLVQSFQVGYPQYALGVALMMFGLAMLVTVMISVSTERNVSAHRLIASQKR